MLKGHAWLLETFVSRPGQIIMKSLVRFIMMIVRLLNTLILVKVQQRLNSG